MRRRSDPAQIARLVDIQRVRRIAAEAALADARRAESIAAAREDAARRRLRDAESFWTDHLSAATFAPERAVALAAQVIAGEIAARYAGGQLADDRTKRDQRAAAWRLAEAQVRSIEIEYASACRGEGRRRDEKRLAARDDLTARQRGDR